MNVVIETPRLLLREFTEADARLLYELNLDPEVTRFTHDPMVDADHSLVILEQVIIPQYALYNHGRWAVHLKQGLAFTGWCGLKFIPERKEIDLGYRFSKNYWGRGYATEAAYACIQYGFEELGLERIVGKAEAGNQASIKVLEKCGLHYVGDEVIDGFATKLYQIFRPLIQ